MTAPTDFGFGMERGAAERMEMGIEPPGEEDEELEIEPQIEPGAPQVLQDNEAEAPGQVCGRCGRPIEAGQDARLRADDVWVHEECPTGARAGESAENQPT